MSNPPALTSLPDLWYAGLPCDGATFRLCHTSRRMREKCDRAGLYRAADAETGAPSSGRCAALFDHIKGRPRLCPVTVMHKRAPSTYNVRRVYVAHDLLQRVFDGAPDLGSPNRLFSVSINGEAHNNYAGLALSPDWDAIPGLDDLGNAGEQEVRGAWVRLATSIVFEPWEWSSEPFDNSRHSLGAALTIVLTDV